MRRLPDIIADENSMTTLVNLTDALQGLASIRIAHIKNQVQKSQEYFDELWRIYNQIRVDQAFRFGRTGEAKIINKELLIAITAESGFNGDIDEKLINWMLEKHDPAKQDIIIIGHHGVVKLTQAGVSFNKYYKLPESDTNLNVRPLVSQVRLYRSTSVYYQTYVSLMVQDIKKIELKKAVQEAGDKVELTKEDVISEATYIFEPSTYAVVAHLERAMLEISLLQTILDSKLAQYAARFRSMSLAHKKAAGTQQDLHVLYNQTRRSLNDERLKNIINGIKKVRKAYVS
ncbi:MAG TPA: F0F1 ATP synthase subunit gamma [Candidatus Saccharimonadales bacterium]|nr:F0F1 ATP synthase subunit gamma [Candidatus Saccharimonadales bacterium]